MGIFSKQKNKGVVTEEGLQQAKVRVLATYALAEVFDEQVLKPADPAQGFRQALQDDLAFFTACLSTVDGKPEEVELAMINDMLGTAYDMDGLAKLFEGKDPQRCTRMVPPSFVILYNFRNDPIVETVADSAIKAFDLAGMAVASADGTFDKEEGWEINGFVATLRRYVAWK